MRHEESIWVDWSMASQHPIRSLPSGAEVAYITIYQEVR
jgi:hypothetical protein